MNTECVVPEWLHDIILGYGDPSAAHYEKMEGQIATLDYNDTFIDVDHLRSCFPDYQIKFKTDDPRKLVRPFRLTFEDLDLDEGEEKKKVIVVEPHKIPRRGPYHFNEPKKWVFNCNFINSGLKLVLQLKIIQLLVTKCVFNRNFWLMFIYLSEKVIYSFYKLFSEVFSFVDASYRVI